MNDLEKYDHMLHKKYKSEKYEKQENDRIILQENSIFFIVERRDTVLQVNSEDNTVEFEVEKIYTPENLIAIFLDGQIHGCMLSHDFAIRKQIECGKFKL
jgi:hypothetical protein